MTFFDPNKDISDFLDKIEIQRLETRSFKKNKIDTINKLFTYLEEHEIYSSCLSPSIRYRLVKVVMDYADSQVQKIYAKTLLKECTLEDAILAIEAKDYPLLKEMLAVQQGESFVKNLLLNAMQQDDLEANDLICNALSDLQVVEIFEPITNYSEKFILRGNPYVFEKIFNRLDPNLRNQLFSDQEKALYFLSQALASGSKKIVESIYFSLSLELKTVFFTDRLFLPHALISTAGNKELHAFIKEIVPQETIDYIFEHYNLLTKYLEVDFNEFFLRSRQNNPHFEFDLREGLETIYQLCPDRLKPNCFIDQDCFKIAKHKGHEDLIPTLLKIYPPEWIHTEWNLDRPGGCKINNLLVLLQYVSESLKEEIFRTKSASGYNLLHMAVEWLPLPELQELFNLCPEHLKHTLFDKDLKGNTPFHLDSSLVYRKNILEMCPENLRSQLFSDNDQGDSAFAISIQYGVLSEIKGLYDLYPVEMQNQLFKPNKKGDTPFHFGGAASYERMKLVYDLCPLESRAPFFGRNQAGDTAFDLLIQSPDPYFFKACLNLYPQEMRESLFDKNSSGNTPFHRAVRSNNLRVIRDVYDLYPDRYRPHLFDVNEEGDTPFHTVALYGDMNLIIMLYGFCHNKSHLFIKNKAGNTPFHLGVQLGSWNLINKIYALCPEAMRADLFDPNFNGNTPLHLATANYLKIFELAPEEKRSRLLSANQAGDNPVDIFFKRGIRNPEIVFLMAKLPDATVQATLDQLDLEKLQNLVDSFFPSNRDCLDIVLDFKNPRLDVMILDYLIENSLLNDLRNQLIERVISCPDYLFLSTNLLSYMSQKNEEFVFEQVERKGGLDQLTPEQLVAILPLLKPSRIVQVIERVPLDQQDKLLNTQVEHEKQTFSLQEILTYMDAHYIPSLKNSNVSNVILGALQSGLAKIPLSSLSLLTKKIPEKIWPFVPYMDDNQLAATIPFMNANSAMQSVSSTIKRSYLIKRMTLDQKKKVLEKVSFYPADLLSLEQQVIDFKASIKPREGLFTLQARFSTSHLLLLEIQRLKEAFLKNESDEDLIASVRAKEQEAAVKLVHLKSLMDTLSSSSDEIPSEFTDEMTGGEMSDPVLLPMSNIYVDLSTVNTFEKGDIEGVPSIENPYAKKFFKATDYEVDQELKSRIAEWRAKRDGLL